jgi:hypothetical protein
VSETGIQLRAMLVAAPLWHLGVTIAPIPVMLATLGLVRVVLPTLLEDRS